MNVFVYGSLMDKEIMNYVSGCLPDGEKAVLLDYGRYRIINEQYPGIRHENGQSVEGYLYYNVSSEAVGRLDLFEGDMYLRQEVEVQLENEGVPLKAMVYVVKPGYVKLLTDTAWSFDEFLAEGKTKFTSGYHGFDELGLQEG